MKSGTQVKLEIDKHRGQMFADLFNERYPIGTRVICRPTWGGSEFFESKTRSAAWVLGHGEAVVSIEGRSGGMALWCLTVVEHPREVEALAVLRAVRAIVHDATVLDRVLDQKHLDDFRTLISASAWSEETDQMVRDIADKIRSEHFLSQDDYNGPQG